MDDKVESGSTVSVEYTGKFDDGTVFDSSNGRAPIEFKVGGGEVIKGFDEAVVGMKKGEEKKITIEPEQAYGQRDERLIQSTPKEAFPKGVEVKEGVRLKLQAPDGRMIIATVTKVDDKNVTVDLNHPLAGKKLNFDLKVVDVK